VHAVILQHAQAHNETTDMLKQLLTGGVLALLLLGSLAAQANPKEPGFSLKHLY